GTFGEEPLPPETESRLGQLTELMATAIANADARAEVERLADEQSALRRVATLVAEGAPPAVVFDAVATGIEALLGADGATLCRYEADEEVTIVAQRGMGVERNDDGTARAGVQPTSVEAPIVVDGRLWGVAIANWGGGEAPPDDSEERM